MITLVIGGARSGKSYHAEQLASASALNVIYIATAEAKDAEMSERIQHHRATRPAQWVTVEEPLALGAALRAHERPANCIVIDCLTLWLNNLMAAGPLNQGGQESMGLITRLKMERTDFLEALRTTKAEVIVVSNEVGTGIVPMGVISRRFIDEAGRLNQAVAQCASRVVWMVAGCPIYAKRPS